MRFYTECLAEHAILRSPFVSMSTSEIVRKEARRLFGASKADEVISALDRTDLSLGTMGADRVHLAILLLSKGEMQQFREVLRHAQQDWRDTLVVAGLADGDWLSIL